MKIFTLCKKYLLAHKYMLSAYILIILATSTIGILSPYIIGSFLDALIEGGDISVILRFCAIFGGLSIIKILKGYVTAIMNTKMQCRMGHSFNMHTMRHLQNQSLTQTGKHDSAYLSQRVGTDTASLIGFCVGILQSIITNVIMLVAPFIILLTLHRGIAMILLSFLVAYFVLYFAFRNKLYNASLAFKEAQSKFAARLYEQVKYIKQVKS